MADERLIFGQRCSARLREHTYIELDNKIEVEFSRSCKRCAIIFYCGLQ
jgi:hypothetical protein